MLNRKLSSWLPALTGVALVTLSATCYGIEDRIVATFAANTEGAHDADGVPKTIAWSSAQNAGGGASSGSAYVVVSWANAGGWQDSKLAIDDIDKTDLAWPGVDCRQYINLEFDVKVDVANSYPAVNGTYGGVQLVFQGWGGANGNPDGLGWSTMSSLTIENTSDWQHMSFPLSSFPYNVNRVILNFYVSPGTNTIAYFVDNVRFTAPPSPPPTLSFKPAPPSGLTCIASKSGDQWQRQMIRTANGTYSFHTGTGAGPTTSYALTITNFPGPGHSGFLAQMFLVPEFVGGDNTKTNMPWGPTDSSVDWNAGNVMYLTVGMNADGSAYSDFRYKTNNFSEQNMALNDQDGGQYGTNGWSKGHLATLACPTGPLGTWTLTFNNNTSLTWTAPDGSSTNFNIAADAADVWKDPMYVYVGVQPNAMSRIGQSATFSRLKITGAAASVDETFGAPYALDTTLWAKNAADGTGIFVTGPTGKYWVNWTTPDPGFTTLYCTDNLTNSLVKGQWADLQIPSSQWVTVGDKRLAIVTESGLNTALPNWNQNQLYFSLFKRVATKLQVLLPGETAAPGTPSGKTGTPTALTVYTFFNVTVNAVDDDWNLVNSVSDTVELTCTDVNAYIAPTTISLTGGTGTFADLYLGSVGNFTFTATDKTDSAVAPNTSSSMTSLDP